jgi:hypothetical protein
MYIRMRVLHCLDAFRRGDQHQRANVLAAVAFEHVDGGDQGTAGGQHRVDDQRHALVELADKALEDRARASVFHDCGQSRRR